MKLTLTSLLVLAIPHLAFAQNRIQPKLRVAVGDLAETLFSETVSYEGGSEETSIAIPPPEGFAMSLTEMLTTALVESGRFVVLERSEIDQVLGEQDFGESGRVTQSTAASTAHVLGAQALITGAIAEYSYSRSSLGGNVSVLNRVRASGQQLKASVGIDLRLIDTATGEVMLAKRGTGSATSRNVSASVTLEEDEFGTSLSSSTPLGRASRDAIEEIVALVVEALADVAWTGRIVDVRGSLIYLNAGTASGITPGLELEVFQQEDPLIDPATGLNLGAPEGRVGSIRVTEVADRYAVAVATDGTAFARDHVLRLTTPPARH